MKFTVEDTQLLRALCGPQDVFLTEIEEVTQGVVYAHGNTFTYQGPMEELFASLMRELVLSLQQGKEITQNLIVEITDSLQVEISGE